ncbi:MAG: sugar transferase [Firmicutes bacterium]|nr:sugar transferase [Bacillota bacterium]
MYKKYVKRFLDIMCAFAAITVFSWIYVILTIIGSVAMRGNPFFTQPRPGKDEKIFKLIKFRTMDNRRDGQGNLLADSVRLNGYGRFLRKTSLDELPEAFNILKGDMSVVGPRPLLVKYLPLYSEEQRHRHDVRPGLSGLAQISGRNGLSWEEKFKFDVEYTQKVSFWLDVKIVALTVWKAFVKSEGINQEGEATMEEFVGTSG